jgi:hypothetical protein
MACFRRGFYGSSLSISSWKALQTSFSRSRMMAADADSALRRDNRGRCNAWVMVLYRRVMVPCSSSSSASTENIHASVPYRAGMLSKCTRHRSTKRRQCSPDKPCNTSCLMSSFMNHTRRRSLSRWEIYRIPNRNICSVSMASEKRLGEIDFLCRIPPCTKSHGILRVFVQSPHRERT